ncbi:hypothetical protein ACGFRB_11510 [Streptomyces sp. NPDC048718]|uniref:hypothetical protein n=1 Tax=Streptomyces sp. NPDC048718 TaxID=3365587 RepID=UPI003718B8AE
MRPHRFTDLVRDLAADDPAVSRARTLAEDGDTKHPFGLSLTLTSSGESRWQFAGQLPDGAKHEGFTDEPVTGAPAPAMGAPGTADVPEAWFAAVLTAAECPEIKAVERWSTRPAEAGESGRSGLTVTFHNGARIFARQM